MPHPTIHPVSTRSIFIESHDHVAEDLVGRIFRLQQVLTHRHGVTFWFILAEFEFRLHPVYDKIEAQNLGKSARNVTLWNFGGAPSLGNMALTPSSEFFNGFT